jgi:hypothetical protein
VVALKISMRRLARLAMGLAIVVLRPSAVKVVVLLSAIFSPFGVDAQTNIPWQPTTADWFCPPQNTDETLCTLVADGLLPSGVATPTTGTAIYRILKGRVLGVGQVLLTSQVDLKCFLPTPTLLRCYAENAIKLGPGVSPVYGVSPPTTTLTIYSQTPSILFDWDGDGRMTSDREGLMALRYLLGFRGASVIQGIPLSNGKTSVSVERDIVMAQANGWLSFSGNVAPLTQTDGILFERCLRGLRGTELVASLSANPIAAAANCADITLVQ